MMNRKTQKIVVAVIAVVIALTMVLSMVAPAFS
jgi:hypothetical protein